MQARSAITAQTQAIVLGPLELMLDPTIAKLREQRQHAGLIEHPVVSLVGGPGFALFIRLTQGGAGGHQPVDTGALSLEVTLAAQPSGRADEAHAGAADPRDEEAAVVVAIARAVAR